MFPLVFKGEAALALKAFWLYPYQGYTSGGTSLIRELEGKKIITKGKSKYKFKPRKHVVINWGSRNTGDIPTLNSAAAVTRCIDKLAFFNHHSGASRAFLPEFTTSRQTAEGWVRSGSTVVARTVLNGHSGEGIVICVPDGKNPVPDAPLYTKYIPKDQEYRVHIVKGTDGTFDNFYNQRKVKRKDFTEKHNRYVRCFNNGYTYQHNDLDIPSAVIEAAINVFNASGLDFGAVDVIYSKSTNRGYVLEINTAPGLEGASIEKYAEVFKKYFGGK